MNDIDIWNLSLPSGFELAPLDPPVILVVDDREENLFAMKKTLAKLDAEVMTASSGADALALSLRQSFALILLDVQMPTMNGFEVAECLRENEETASIPIIFITAISKEEQYVFKGYDSGAVDYIFKPVNRAILLAKCSVFINLARQQSHLKRLALALSELNERHARLLQSMNEGVIGFNMDGKITFANPIAQKMLHAPNSLVGKHVLPFLSGKDVVPGEWKHHPVYKSCLKFESLHLPDSQMWREDGTKLDVEMRFGPFSPEHGPSGGVLTFADITARKRLDEILKHQATYDQLTGIPNRTLFYDTLAQAIARARRANRSLALCYMDLNNFKPVNDGLGHAYGDELLKAFADRCRQEIRTGDFFARIGGDEFVILVEDNVTRENLEVMAQKLCSLGDDAFDVKGKLLSIGVSVGVAICPEGNCDLDTFINFADQLMYQAKQSEQGWVLSTLDATES